MIAVEALERDPHQWNSTLNQPVHRSVQFALSNRCHARLMREATERMAGYGIDWSLYKAPAVIVGEICPDFCIGTVEWRHKSGDFGVQLAGVWFDRKTGRIDQCGTEHGDLVA